MMSLRRLKHVLNKMYLRIYGKTYLRDVSQILIASIFNCSKMPQKIVLCDICKSFKMSDKIYAGSLNLLKTRNVFWGAMPIH